MVVMGSWRLGLILSIIGDRVVDLPEPVGPVTRINPRGFSQSLETIPGSPSCKNDLISNGITRNTAPVDPRWLKRLPRKRASPFNPNQKYNSRFYTERYFTASYS